MTNCPLSRLSVRTVQNKVFDRKTKLLQQERAAGRSDVESFDFLKEEVGYRVADRLLDVSRKMSVGVGLQPESRSAA